MAVVNVAVEGEFEFMQYIFRLGRRGRGPKTVPWGTPEVIGEEWDRKAFSWIN